MTIIIGQSFFKRSVNLSIFTMLALTIRFEMSQFNGKLLRNCKLSVRLHHRRLEAEDNMIVRDAMF